MYSIKIFEIQTGMFSCLIFTFLTVSVIPAAVSQQYVTTRKPLKFVPCLKDEECTVNAYCHLGRCTCETGFLPYRETIKSPVHCIKEATALEDYCERDLQCQAALGKHSQCVHNDPASNIGKCYCYDYAHYVHKLCYKTAYIGDFCEVNDNCFIESKNLQAYCDRGRCICPPNHHASDDKKDCHPTSELGGPCITDEGCITPDSECTDNVCTCKREFMETSDNKTCLQVAKRLGDVCDEDGQCLVAHHFAVCDNKTRVCTCEKGAHMMDETCWKSAGLKEPCGHNFECKWNLERAYSVECTDGICQCSPGYVVENNECVHWDPKGGSGSKIPYCTVLLVVSFVFSILSS